MTRIRCARASVLLLLLSLLALPANAGEVREPRSPSKGRSVIALLVRTVGELFPFLGKSSGTMDPDGSSKPTSGAPAEPDASGTMDPDGRS